MIKTIVVDDEVLARKRILDLLPDYPEFLVVGECKNGIEAVKAIETEQPDVIFVDVRMPGLSGLEVAKSASYSPIFVFVTAFEEHALRAFEVKALDYLLKPFEESRFHETISRIKEAYQLRQTMVLKNKIEQLLVEQNNQKVQHTISVREKGAWQTISTSDIYYLKAEGAYVRIYNKDKYYLNKIGIQELCYQLDQKLFLQIHRGIVINVTKMKQYKYLGVNFQYEFTLTNDVKLISGRTFKPAIDDFFETTNRTK